ncbi:MAG: hypothetical protein LBD08_02120 [Treponema sp.]|jgi:hypothetical protein|nr:hypothetical protein [Treponema sp.]
MTLNEKLDVLLQVSALRDSGNGAEADILVKTVPLPPYLAKIWKDHGYAGYLKNSGWNMAEAEAAFGPDWLNR